MISNQLAVNSMSEIIIRKFIPTDEKAIENITYRTGFKGAGLEGRDYFNDRHLFYLIFIAYYARFEPEHFFVAEETESQQVVGFICGTFDTEKKASRFNRLMLWRIFLRAIFFTSWRYPKTMLTSLKLAFMLIHEPAIADLEVDLQEQYPAHLHINLLPEYQRTGTGSRLITTFENHLRSHGVQGLHLGTSSRNTKAVPFYEKHGYQIIEDVFVESHPVFENIHFLTFAKSLIPSEN